MTTLKDLIIREGLENSSIEDIVDTLNDIPELPNPEPQKEIGNPVSSMEQIFQLVQTRGNTVNPNTLSNEDKAAYLAAVQADLGVIHFIAEIIRDGNTIAKFIGIPSVGNAIGLVKLLINFGLSETVADAIEARLNDTIPDPSWKPLVYGLSLAEAEGLGMVTAEEVTTALQT